MDRKNSGENEHSKEELLSRFKRDDALSSESKQKNRRGILKTATVSVLSTLGLSHATKTTAATRGESVNVSEDDAHKVIGEYRSRLRHLAEHGILRKINVSSLVGKAASESSNAGEVQAEVIRGPKGDTEPAIRVLTRGPKGEVDMWFPLNGDYALFDLPDHVDSESLSDNWNDQVSSQDNIGGGGSGSSCPDCNDGCCCNVCSCDNCHCTYWGYCDCTNVAGTDCWYRYCDCCPDAVNYCTRYCGAPLSTNC